MEVRQADVNEMKKLWEYSDTPTYKHFVKGIESGLIEFWTVEVNSDLVGELYIIWDSPDKDEADGKKRAYLCAFRINKLHQGQGHGSKLMQKVIKRIYEKGFREITIGADNDDYERLSAMYHSWGFDELVKTQNIDYHYLDIDNNPTKSDEPWNLYIMQNKDN